jgi:hypothetical protein
VLSSSNVPARGGTPATVATSPTTPLVSGAEVLDADPGSAGY